MPGIGEVGRLGPTGPAAPPPAGGVDPVSGGGVGGGGGGGGGGSEGGRLPWPGATPPPPSGALVVGNGGGGGVKLPCPGATPPAPAGGEVEEEEVVSVERVTPRGSSPIGLVVMMIRSPMSAPGGGQTATGVVMISTSTPPVTREPIAGGVTVGGRRSSPGMLPQP